MTDKPEITEVNIAQRKFGELVNELATFLNDKCDHDLPLIVAVLHGSLFQHELLYRLWLIEEVEKARTKKSNHDQVDDVC